MLARDSPLLQRAIRGALSKRTISRLSASAAEFTRRQDMVPSIRYQSNLPISSVLPEIVSALNKHQVIVVAGETGSGKTTQLPLACLNAGLGARGMICHTQPRRLAARSVADRLAQQLNTNVGELVGYAVRFEDRVSEDTLVKVMTDGLLLTEIRHDRFLYAYDTVIVDEAHERSLNVDFLIGYLKHLLTKRSDLRVIVTSATIDVQAFSKFFDDAPVFVVEGRSYPIETRYMPIEGDAEDTLATCLKEIETESTSSVQDVLVFLPGEREIFSWAQWLRKFYRGKYEVLPLYARLPTSEQRRIFSKSEKRRILLATNIAETSLTVPNVRFVIDFGEARISRFSTRSRIQRLPIEAISQASAHQRAGRCGRIAPGLCFRLYSESDFLSRDAYTEPQIKRTNIASVVLQMIVFGFGEIASFPFLDRPDERSILAAVRLLHELGALENDRITDLGRQMARIPVDPRLARMLVEATNQSALKELLIIVSALAVQDPFLRPLDRQQAADHAHKKFRHPKSDFLAFLKLWDWVEEVRKEHSWNEVRRVLERSFISSQRYMEWRALHRQLLVTCKHLGMRVSERAAGFAAIHKSILSGSLSFLGLRMENSSYLGARNLKFWLFPGSVNAVRKPKWVVAASIVETSKVYARGLAEIKPNWIEPYVESIQKCRIHDHFWDTKRNDSCTNLDISVYGLPVVQNRTVRLKDFEKQAARDLFLVHALVRNQGNINVPEIEANFALRNSLQELQSQVRRTDFIHDDEVVAEIYSRILPEEVCDRASFLRWYRIANGTQRNLLRLLKEDLLLKPESTLRRNAFPSELEIGSVRFALRYKFGPNRVDDGVSILVPLAELTKLNEKHLEWCVPGFFEQKCEELLRGLPKQIRKKLAPIPDKVRELAPLLLHPGTYRVDRLPEVLSQRIRALFHVDIDSSIWRLNDVSAHLKMNVQVLNHDDKIINQGRNLTELRQTVQHHIEERFDDSLKAQFEARGLQEFPPSGLPHTLTVKSQSGNVRLFPFLVDRGDSVDVQVGFNCEMQYENSLRGMCRLVLLCEHQTVRYLSTQFNNDDSLQLYSVNLGNIDDFRQTIFLTVARDTFFSSRMLPESAQEFQRIIARKREHFIPNALGLLDLISNVLSMRHRLILRLDSLENVGFEETRQDIKQQLDSLFAKNFPYSFSVERQPDLARYLSGIDARLDRISGKLQKDLLAIQEIKGWQDRLEALAMDRSEPHVDELFHLLQEYRLSLFCQDIKTRIKISPKRLEQSFKQVEQAG